MSDPDFAVAYPGEVEAIPADLRPEAKTVLGGPGGGVDVAVRPPGNTHEVIGQLGDGPSAPPVPKSAGATPT